MNDTGDPGLVFQPEQTPVSCTTSSPGVQMTKDCTPKPEPLKIYGKRRRVPRIINISIRLSAEEFERLRLRALMLRTDTSKLIRSRLDDIISAEHICEVCRKNIEAEIVKPESDGNLFGKI